jgi:hypothetical protein
LSRWLFQGDIAAGRQAFLDRLDTMNVRQLLDIVAFLDSKYEIMVEDYD